MNRILERAARVIEERGWCQGHYETKSGAVCTSRAISIATDEVGNDMHDRFRARDTLALHIGRDSIASWNDVKGRTKEEVVTKLREAAQ
jgi:hypothetical protein